MKFEALASRTRIEPAAQVELAPAAQVKFAPAALWERWVKLGQLGAQVLIADFFFQPESRS